jgi:hypothetical protein
MANNHLSSLPLASAAVASVALLLDMLPPDNSSGQQASAVWATLATVRAALQRIAIGPNNPVAKAKLTAAELISVRGRLATPLALLPSSASFAVPILPIMAPAAVVAARSSVCWRCARHTCGSDCCLVTSRDLEQQASPCPSQQPLQHPQVRPPHLRGDCCLLATFALPFCCAGIH